MTDLSLTHAALISARASALALVAVVNMLLDATMDAPVETPKPEAPTPEATTSVVPDNPILAECPHPPRQQVPVPTMGHPNRFMCQACGKTVDP